MRYSAMDDISAEWMTAPARDCGSDNDVNVDDADEEEEPIRKRSKRPELPVPAPWYGGLLEALPLFLPIPQVSP